MASKNTAVFGIYPSSTEAERAVDTLIAAGFARDPSLSALRYRGRRFPGERSVERHVCGGYRRDQRKQFPQGNDCRRALVGVESQGAAICSMGEVVRNRLLQPAIHTSRSGMASAMRRARSNSELHLVVHSSLRPPAKPAAKPRPINTLPVTKRSQSK
jgi:hypothetical protein